jgi:DDB1- and CUL4-associated factor 4
LYSSCPKGIAVDPSEDLLFAAGQDCRIRAWSLRTGQPLYPPVSSPSESSSSNSRAAGGLSRAVDDVNPFVTTFDSPIVALQVTEEREGMCLWAASADFLHRYDLGQRAEQ